MYGIYTNIWGILMVYVTIYSIHGSYIIYIYKGRSHIELFYFQWHSDNQRSHHNEFRRHRGKIPNIKQDENHLQLLSSTIWL